MTTSNLINLYHLFTTICAKEAMQCPVFVCLSVCSSDCLSVSNFT